MNTDTCKNTTKKIVSGTLSMTVAALIVKLIGLAYKIPLSYILTDEGMGYFNSAYTVYSLFYLISTAGVPKAITILISDAKSKGNTVEKRKIYSVSIRAFAILGLVFSVVLCLFSEKFAILIGNPLSRYTMIFIAPSIFFTAVSGVIRGYLCAYMKFYHIAISQLIDAILKTVLGISLAMLAYSRGYSSYLISAFTILGATIGAFVSTVYLIIVSKTSNTIYNIEQKNDNIRASSVIFRVIKISLPITLSAAALSMANVIDLFLVMKRLAELGYSTSQASVLYGNYTTLVVPMIGLGGALLAPVAMSTMPALASAFSKSDIDSFSKHLNFALKVSAFVAIPLSFGLTFFSKEVLALIFDDADATVAAPILSIGATAIVFYGILTVINCALESVGVVNAPIYSMLFGGAVKFVSSYFLIGSENFGISGAPIGTTLCYATALAISSILLYKKCRLRISFISILFFPFLNSALMIILTKVVMNCLSGYLDGYLYSVMCIATCGAFYILSTLFFYTFCIKLKKIGKNAQKIGC